jgi:hypothetical protein
MPQPQPLAEIIRTRCVVEGLLCGEGDLVVCLAEDEADLLAERPYLSGHQRHTTCFFQPNIVLYVPPVDLSALYTALAASSLALAGNGDVGV